MTTMIRPRQTFAANNATPQKRSLPLGFEPKGRVDQLGEKNGRLTLPAATASGLRVPQVAAKEEGSVLYVRDQRLRGKMGCPGPAQR